MKKYVLFFVMTFFVSLSYAQKVEAESGALYGAKIESEKSIAGNYSGSGYIKFSSLLQGNTELTVKVKKEKEYTVQIKYALLESKEAAAVKVELDGLYLAAQKLPLPKSSSDFSTVYINNSMLISKGEHKIKVSSYRGDWILDSIELVEVNDSIKKQIFPSNTLATPNPSSQAVKLFDYLLSMRGKGILSGQQIYGQNTNEIKILEKTLGKTPAILGIDLIDFSPSRVAKGASGGRTIAVAKKFWTDGGIISCCWHWNAPANLVDKDLPEKHWYDGFRSGATTFNFPKGLKDKESEEYKLMIRDIDAIAKQLKLLQDSGVPVLWRPIHEASGKWFWWGAHGKENYIELYKLLFDRLVNHHGLNNLIWVWNGQDPDWYPGDEYVDVIAYDYYPMKYKHGTADEYLVKIQAATELPKLCAISENGALPNIVKLAQENSVWSWFCTWNGDFVVSSNGRSYSESNTKLDSLKLYYENPYTITKDELPDLK
ncbi:MAG: hypothetical protein K5829_09640 [Treponema sp.]|nr:hypothetical protein [Treponema sp.]